MHVNDFDRAHSLAKKFGFRLRRVGDRCRMDLGTTQYIDYEEHNVLYNVSRFVFLSQWRAILPHLILTYADMYGFFPRTDCVVSFMEKWQDDLPSGLLTLLAPQDGIDWRPEESIPEDYY